MSYSDLISTTSNIALLSRSGAISAARKVFDEMPERDTFAWNAIITAYSRSGLPLESLSLFSALRSCGVRPDPFSFTAAIAASADLRDLTAGRKLHALVLRLGLRSSLPVCNSLVDMYGKCSCPSDAARVFEEMEVRNEVSWCSLLFGYANSGRLKDAHQLFDDMPIRKTIAWNILIAGFARFGRIEKSIGLFKKMQMLGFEGDVSTFAILMNACSELPGPVVGRMIHAVIFRGGWDAAVEVSNSVLSFYANQDCRDDASKIFKSMGVRSQVSWNAMIDAYMKVGDVREALSLFRRAPENNIVTWTSMITGFTRSGHGEQALVLFLDMTRTHIRPDDFTFGTVLHACALLAVLGNGMMIHSSVIRGGFDSYVYVANGLVNMYAKCGNVDSSIQVFGGIVVKDLVSWNAMLFGFALHGLSLKAFEVFEDMLARGVAPDKVTFIGLLMVCSHSGLVEEGKTYFETMTTAHGVPPDEDHVTCIVDMLGRAGYLREVSELLEGCSRMDSERSTNSCEALLGACVVRRDVSIGRKVGEVLVRVEPHKEAGYVMLSNLYCASGRWKEAEKVRREMVDGGVKKAPGCSWIEVRERVMVFITGSQSLVHMVDVHTMLGLLESEMRNPSYVCFSRES